jgi:cholesterol transport system auxiliary component
VRFLRSARGGVLCAGLAALALALAGCAAVPGGGPAPLDTVTLSALPASVTETGRASTQILVAEPRALKIHDSQNIVVATSATGLEYLGGAQWADRLPSLVQAKIAESLQNAGVAGGVGLPGQGLAIDYQIITEIRDFSIRTAGGDTASVALFVKLLNDRNGAVIGSRLFSATSPATQGAFPEALDRAFSAVVAEIAEWTSARI